MGMKTLFMSFISPNPENEYVDVDFSKIEKEEDVKSLKEAMNYTDKLAKNLVSFEKEKKKNIKTETEYSNNGKAKVETVQIEKTNKQDEIERT